MRLPSDTQFVSRILEETRNGNLKWRHWGEEFATYGSELASSQALTLSTTFGRGQDWVVLALRRGDGSKAYVVDGSKEDADPDIRDALNEIWKLAVQSDLEREMGKAMESLGRLSG
jgi:hypothetical protein